MSESVGYVSVFIIAATLFSFLWLGILSMFVELITEGFKFFYNLNKTTAPRKKKNE